MAKKKTKAQAVVEPGIPAGLAATAQRLRGRKYGAGPHKIFFSDGHKQIVDGAAVARVLEKTAARGTVKVVRIEPVTAGVPVEAEMAERSKR